MEATPIPPEIRRSLDRLGIISSRMLNGKIYGIQRFLFTYGLLTDIDPFSPYDFYKDRYCFQDFTSANYALCSWDGEGLPPGPWIKRKGESGELRNPNFTDKN